MKKTFALLLAVVLALGMFSACAKTEDTTVAPIEWTGYDTKVAEVKSATDFVSREATMHELEDQLMSTGAVCPIYYYNDVYMQRSTVTGIYSNVYGTKYFMYSDVKGGNTLRLNLASEPDYLDPALNSSVDGACLAANSFSGLFMYNEAGETIPALVDTYTVSDDGLVYAFTLKDGLKWSDGSALTADDLVYSWKRSADPKTGADYAYMLSGIAGYDDIGVYSETEKDEEGNPVLVSSDTDKLQVASSENGKVFTVTLSAPCAYFLDLCAFPTFLPVKQSEVESYADYQDVPGHWCQDAGFISNGAYVLESWTHDESMVYVKNPNYWDAANVKVERLEFMLSADDTAIFAAYNAGDLDFIDTVPTDEIAALLSNDEFHIVKELGTYYISFNVKSKLFAGKTVDQASAMRKALALLIDRDYICENIGQTGQEPANTFIPAGMLDGHGGEFRSNDDSYTYPDAENKGYFDPHYSQDNLDEAITLLKSAGYKFDNSNKLSADTPITFEYLTNETSGHIAIAEAVQQDFAKIGINMSIKIVDWNVFLEERKSGNYDIARNGWIADFNDAINMLEMWVTASGNNDCQFGK